MNLVGKNDREMHYAGSSIQEVYFKLSLNKRQKCCCLVHKYI